MHMVSIKELRLLSVVFISVLFFSLDSLHAQDQTRDEAKDAAIQEVLAKDSAGTSNYRQELGKAVVVKEEFFPQEFDSYLRYIAPRGASAQSGKVGIVDSAAEYSYEIKAFGRLPVQFGIGSRYIGIENTTLIKLPAHLTSAVFGVETTLPFFNFDKTYLTMGIAPSFFSDNWNFRSASFSLIQRYFLIYQPNEKWVFVCGAEYSLRFREPVSPILGFIYKPNDRLTFSIIPESPEISYLLSDKLAVFIQGSSTSNEYRVTKDNLKNVVLNYNEMHLGAGIRYKWNKHITGSFSAGGMFNRSIEYRQDNLGKVVVEDGFYTEFRLVMAI